MSKRKGLSVDEKRTAILKIYHEAQEPFNLKEVEHLGSRAGVVEQTIKEINQSLVDDNMVSSDKIGSANFFWSFPSKLLHNKMIEKENIGRSLDNVCKAITELEDVKRTLCTNRSVGPDRAENLKILETLKGQEKDLDVKLEAFKMNDPEQINIIFKQSEINLQSANRWTDNIWAVKKYLVKKKGMSSKEVDKILCIDSNFDYLMSHSK